jgi:Pyruvate/2-oxoacid:ferredoxin oxidoreductase gamma subunit
MKELAGEAGYELGVLRDEPRPAAVKAPVIEPGAGRGAPAAPRPAFSSALRARTGIVLAGTAGERVQTAATLLAEAAILSGLHATQKNDNPVTQGTGFSVSEVILSPGPIGFTGIERPDAVLVVSNDGRAELERAGVFTRVDANTMVLADGEVTLPPLPCAVHRLPLRGAAGAKGAAAAAAAWWLRRTGALDPAAFEAALGRRLGPGAAETRASVERALAAAPPGER